MNTFIFILLVFVVIATPIVLLLGDDSAVINFLRKKFRKHVWKEVRRENLGAFMHYGDTAYEMQTMYRIAIHEECLLTKETRIREISDFFPVKL